MISVASPLCPGVDCITADSDSGSDGQCSDDLSKIVEVLLHFSTDDRQMAMGGAGALKRKASQRVWAS